MVLAGVCAGDATEREYIGKTGIKTVSAEDIDSALDGLDGPVYVHIDLDVLDPAEFGSVCITAAPDQSHQNSSVNSPAGQASSALRRCAPGPATRVRLQ